jgi:hypothetical protein
MNTQRRDIRNAIVTLLKGAGTGAEQRVYSHEEDSQKAGSKTPAILVVMDGEAIELYSESPDRYLRTITFDLEILCHKTQDSIEDDMDDMEREVLSAIGTDPYLGELLKEPIRPTSVRQQISEKMAKKVGAVLLSVEAKYLDDLPIDEEMEDLKTTDVGWDLPQGDGSEDAHDTINSVANPTLYFAQSEIDGLRTKAAGTHATEGARLTAFGDWAYANMASGSLPEAAEADMPTSESAWRKWGNYLVGAAGAYVVTSDEARRSEYRIYLVESMRRMRGYALWGPDAASQADLTGAAFLVGYSFAYDVLHETESYSDQLLHQTEIVFRANAFLAASQDDATRWKGDRLHNIHHNAMFAMASAAAVMRPHDEAWSDEILDVAEAEIETTLELFNLGDSVLSHEGPAYTTLSLHALMGATVVLERIGRAASVGMASNAYFATVGEVVKRAGFNGWQNVIGFADNDGSWYQGPQSFLRRSAALFSDGEAQWLATHLWGTAHGAKNGGRGVAPGLPLWFEFLWYDPTVAEVAIAGDDPMWHEENLGLVTWNDGGYSASDTSAFLKAGPPTGAATWALALASDPRLEELGIGHEQPCGGMLAFNPGGNLFLSGVVYPKPKRTAMGGCPTFTPVNAIEPILSDAAVNTVWEVAAASQFGARDEVGQIGEWLEWFGPVGTLLSESPEPVILDARGDAGHLFVIADITESYPATYALDLGGSEALAMTQMLRSMFVIDEIAIIVDHVEVSGDVTINEYFRTIHQQGETSGIVFAGQEATVTAQGLAHTLEAIYPAAGLTTEEGQHVISWENATGVNDRTVTDWAQMPIYSRYAKFSQALTAGDHGFVFLAKGNGQTVTSVAVDDTDPLGFTIAFTYNGNDYTLKITRSLNGADRQTFLGDPALYYTLAVA